MYLVNSQIITYFIYYLKWKWLWNLILKVKYLKIPQNLGKRHYFLGELLGNTHALRKHHYFLGHVLGNRSALTKDHLKALQGKRLEGK